MCVDRIRIAKRGIQSARSVARHLRRLRAFIEKPTFPLPDQLPRVDSESESDSENTQEDILWMPYLPEVNNMTQSAHLRQLADSTIRLMHRNSDIQRRVAELKKDTYDYVMSVLGVQENRQKFMDYFGMPYAPQNGSASDAQSVPTREDSQIETEDDMKDISCEDEAKNDR